MPEQPSPSPFPDDVVEKLLGIAKKAVAADKGIETEDDVIATTLDAALTFLQKHYVSRDDLGTEIRLAYFAGYTKVGDPGSGLTNGQKSR